MFALWTSGSISFDMYHCLCMMIYSYFEHFVVIFASFAWRFAWRNAFRIQTPVDPESENVGILPTFFLENEKEKSAWLTIGLKKKFRHLRAKCSTFSLMHESFTLHATESSSGTTQPQSNDKRRRKTGTADAHSSLSDLTRQLVRVSQMIPSTIHEEAESAVLRGQISASSEQKKKGAANWDVLQEGLNIGCLHASKCVCFAWGGKTDLHGRCGIKKAREGKIKTPTKRRDLIPLSECIMIFQIHVARVRCTTRTLLRWRRTCVSSTTSQPSSAPRKARGRRCTPTCIRMCLSLSPQQRWVQQIQRGIQQQMTLQARREDSLSNNSRRDCLLHICGRVVRCEPVIRTRFCSVGGMMFSGWGRAYLFFLGVGDLLRQGWLRIPQIEKDPPAKMEELTFRQKMEFALSPNKEVPPTWEKVVPTHPDKEGVGPSSLTRTRMVTGEDSLRFWILPLQHLPQQSVWLRDASTFDSRLFCFVVTTVHNVHLCMLSSM